MAIYPGLTLSEDEVDTIVDYTTRIGRALEVRGLMNIQYVVIGGPAYRSPKSGAGSKNETQVYVIEVNPRSSRDDSVHLEGDGGPDGQARGQGDAGPDAA